MPEQAEAWQPIPGFPGYEASNHGQVRSLDRIVVMTNGRRRRQYGRIRKPWTHPNGYLIIAGLPNARSRPVHVLVCLAFHGPKPEPDMVVRHLNGVSTDNRPENLAWGTHSENNFDLVRHGTHWKAAQTQCKWGHEFNEENTYFRPEGGRRCRTCKRLRQRKRAA
jgi:hypothetical protein